MIEIQETKDYNLLTELNEEIQTFHSENFPDVFKPYNKEAIAAYFKNVIVSENVVSFIAIDNGKAVAYTLINIVNFPENPFQYSRRYILLDQILVLKSHQSKGIGQKLLDAVFTLAKLKNINLVELNHWTKNESARVFFNKCGFKYYNEKMWKAIE